MTVPSLLLESKTERLRALYTSSSSRGVPRSLCDTLDSRGFPASTRKPREARVSQTGSATGGERTQHARPREPAQRAALQRSQQKETQWETK